MNGEYAKQPETVNITFRKLDFGLDETAPRYWVRNNPFLTHFYHALSALFPDGEKFFMDSVRNLKDRIDDQETLDAIDAFCRQEAHHTHQHNLLNAIAEKRGVNIPFYRSVVKGVLGRAGRMGNIQQLAVTCALEHITAALSHELFENKNISKGMDSKINQLWLWHAMEEIEHKSLCIDIYRKMRGPYFTRILQFTIVNLHFWPVVFLFTFHMLWADKKIGGIRQYLSGMAYLFGPRKGFLTGIIPVILRYYKPSFHPWDLNDSHYIKQWANIHKDMVLN